MCIEKVLLTAYWGNSDADCSVIISSDEWLKLLDGDSYCIFAESWYEGKREEVTWYFSKGLVSIDGEDGAQHAIDTPIQEICMEKVGLSDPDGARPLNKLHACVPNCTSEQQVHAPASDETGIDFQSPSEEVKDYPAIMKEIKRLGLSSFMEVALRIFEQIKPSPPPGSFAKGMGWLYCKNKYKRKVAEYLLKHKKLPSNEVLRTWA